ncbi:alpha/beta-hydrolase [Lojkania enalia]|uniref:Alpha/beta-hydrolase n=1 Tax=Lojkania enalia TaxID=147567 RepID=A0A9P4K1U3_9PLEO|nr:alpha/beta-hydrolase [Didymosphaeria enalia]
MSPSPARPPLLSLVSLIGGMASAGLLQALVYPFRRPRAPTLRQHVLSAVIRAFLRRVIVAQLRYLMPPTSQRCLDFCKSKGEEPEILEVEVQHRKVLAHWIGSSGADIVILFFHGGGYVQPISVGHLEYMHRLVKDFSGPGKSKSLAVLVPEYSLAPEATHPAQLREAAAVLSYLLKECNRPPADILISGDSAGAGLAFTLLSHMLHPHPDVPAITLSEPLLGAFLYSPWISFGTRHDSYVNNANLDILVPRALRCWSAMYTSQNLDDPERDPGLVSGDSYTEPLINDSSWWEGLHQVISEILIWAGGNEILLDGINAMDAKLRIGWQTGGGEPAKIFYIEEAEMAHAQPIMDAMANAKIKGSGQIAIEEWLRSRLER